MKDNGLISIFAVGDFSNNLAAVDWIIPLSGIGNLRGDNETGHDRIIISYNILRDPDVCLEQTDLEKCNTRL